MGKQREPILVFILSGAHQTCQMCSCSSNFFNPTVVFIYLFLDLKPGQGGVNPCIRSYGNESQFIYPQTAGDCQLEFLQSLAESFAPKVKNGKKISPLNQTDTQIEKKVKVWIQGQKSTIMTLFR